MASNEVSKVELVWSGKYDDAGTLARTQPTKLPFQVIETINDTRVERSSKTEQSMTLFDFYDEHQGDTFEDGWKNKLVWGDNLPIMGALLGQFAGKIDLIYIDPPFMTGADFTFKAEIGESPHEIGKERSSIEEKAYRDTWGRNTDSYLAMMYQRLALMRELLSERGSIYVHLDPTVGHYIKVMMDEIFGPDAFQREIIWRIGWISGYKSAAQNWIRNHDNILFYVKTPGNFTFNKTYTPYPPGYTRRDGSQGKGIPIEDVWNANASEHALTGEDSLDSIQIKSFSQEKTGYDTQKNESVLRRIIEASSNENDLVADFFCGSGTTLAVAEKLGRRWIGCDLGRYGVHVSRKRMLDIPQCKPFEVLNLGHYERQYWQGMSFGESTATPPTEQTLFQYLSFVLKLYKAVPVPGMQHIHGKRGTAMVHVGAVDAPVTNMEIDRAIDECVATRQNELHVLGWDWEMGISGPNAGTRRGGPMHDIARSKGVKLSLLQIPNEVMEPQAAGKGDVRFFELAFLDAKIKQPEPFWAQVQLEDFVMPNTELVPEDVRAKIENWSDYIDYWAVDWDFQNDTFMLGWVAFRTRQKRMLPLISARHKYPQAGKYTILVKAVDIFGNDTSQAYDIEVTNP